MQNRSTTTPQDVGLSTFEQADPSARSVEIEMPDTLVFDTDSKRMGEYGGFFLAEDVRSADYIIDGAPADPKSRQRVNGPNNRVTGTHLPSKVHFALVAAGPPFHVREPGDPQPKKVFHFEAVVFCREVIDPRTQCYAMFKLALRGPAGYKMYRYLRLDIATATARMDDHYRRLARKLFEEKRITRERLERIESSHATPQMIWAPVEIIREVPIGKSEEKSVIGAMVHTDDPEKPGSLKRISRWPQVPTELLTLPDTEGGLLLTGAVQQFCQQNRVRYEEALAARAAFKGRVQDNEADAGSGPGAQEAPAPKQARTGAAGTRAGAET